MVVRRHRICRDFSDVFFLEIMGHHRRLTLSICHRSRTSASSRRFMPTRRADELSSRLMTRAIIGFIPSGGTSAIGSGGVRHFGMATTPDVILTALSEHVSLHMRRLEIYNMTPNTALEPTAFTLVCLRFGRGLADDFRRRGSAFGR